MTRQGGERCGDGTARQLGKAGLCVIDEDFVLGGAGRIAVTPSRTRLTDGGWLHTEVPFRPVSRVSCGQAHITQAAMNVGKS
jgi:hypothetical protein